MTVTLRKTARIGVLATLFAGLALGGTAATAAAQPVVNTRPDGEVGISASPGQWWKCALYHGLPPQVTGLPPVVNYPSGPAGEPYTTPDATARFASGTVVLVDCISTAAPTLWLQLIRTE
ncbi:hypothetical protein JK358_36595 [Nocardia sp. 2]|uniref:Ig-like domain-containing protein n=1 Tax=Nocardia acididurans TaxID=2802282 RepID=A0ABS1MIQ5_9NOCA|nr:hypothetical protein [Nocardia acididurans]MBL1079930.1 hypothetical protein [Nocardia acididurans]